MKGCRRRRRPRSPGAWPRRYSKGEIFAISRRKTENSSAWRNHASRPNSAAGDVDDAVHEQDQPQRPRGGLAEQLEPDERHVERQRGVIAEPWRIPESGPEGARAESLDPVADHAPRIDQRIQVADQRRQVSEPERENDPEEGHAEVAERIRRSEQPCQDRQQQRENAQRPHGAQRSAGGHRRPNVDIDRAEIARRALRGDEVADHQERQHQRG